MKTADLRVYHDSPAYPEYLSARFADSTSVGFEYEGQRWTFQYTSEDAQGVFDALARGASAPGPFQTRVQPWMLACFGKEIAADRIERNHRFFEEATEAVQANGMTRSEAHQLVDYTFGRPVGALHQEVGGVMVTLAALCLASGVDMHEAGETELARIWGKVPQIRAKQAAKPKHSPLPEALPGTDFSKPDDETAKLVDYFRTKGSRFGDEGDAEGWTPAETAIAIMERYKATLGAKSRGVSPVAALPAVLPEGSPPPRAAEGSGSYVDIVFDGPPSHESGRFVEVENDQRHSIKCGDWLKRADGYWVLRIATACGGAQ